MSTHAGPNRGVLQPQPGQHLDRYEIQSELGRGGMAVVYKGFDPDLRRHVAIKLTLPHLANDPHFSARFEQESRFGASLNHPNVVAVYEVGRFGNQRFIVMQYVSGGTLGDLLAQQPQPPIDQTLELLQQVATALQTAHRSGIVHRDLKPSNILLDEGGRRALLTDFGIARAIDTMTRLTRPGAVVGTATYMAPEQYVDEQIGPATDQYALGILAYQMLCGRVPFVAATATGVLSMKMHESPPPIQRFNPSLPDKVTAVLNRALAKTPEDRFTGPAEFMDGLMQALASATVAATVIRDRFEDATARIVRACALTIIQGPQPGAVHTIRRDAPFVFGREAGADLVVNDSRVSRRHFRIIHDAGVFWLEDLGSANGTFVNGTRNERKQLNTGDLIKAGTVEFKVSLDGVSASASVSIRDESGLSRTYELRGSMTCGRDPSNDIVLDDDLISRHHMRLLPDADGYRVEDLHSSNGTLVNGRRIQSATLRNGDVILVSKFALEFHQADSRAQGRE
jgi:pSer/pThr/pTyr-binding forkhead associated (FHA) protein